MSSDLRDVISAARQDAARKVDEAYVPRIRQLSVVETELSSNDRVGAAPSQVQAALTGGVDSRGHSSLRLAFWLCGFHDALKLRQGKGEELSEGEQALITLSSRYFTEIRPLVIEMTLVRLDAVVNSSDLQSTAEGVDSRSTMEVFALTTLANLARRSRELLQIAGPDAALCLFGGGASVLEPLAIFQLVFTTALDMVEAFERIIAAKTPLLTVLAEMLDSDVDRI